MYNFFLQAYFIYKGLFWWLTWLDYLGNVVVRPMVQVTIFSILGRLAMGTEKAQSLVLGIAVNGVAWIVVIGIAQMYYLDRQRATLPFFFVSKVNRLTNFLSRSVMHFPNGILSFTCGILTIWLVTGGVPETLNWVGFILAFLVINVSLTAFGQLTGMFGMLSSDLIPLNGLIIGLLVTLTGAIIPITIFPVWLQEFTKFLPTTNGLFALRAAFQGASFAMISSDLLREFLTGLAYLSLAAIIFYFLEVIAKRTGALSEEGAQ